MRYKDLLNTNDILHLLTTKLNFVPRQMGKSIFFLCPFHGDKNPSLSFEPNHKIFTCFSCNFKASDIFDFWSQYKKIEKDEAVIQISQLGYFSLAKFQQSKKKEQKSKNKVFYLNSLVSEIYQHNLFTQPGREVLKYLQIQRQIGLTTIKKFLLGCSISNKQLANLLFHHENDNFSTLDLTTTNLVWISNDNRVSDFFLEKQLIIPLINSEEQIVAFAARKIGEISNLERKYKYLPTHQYYHKSSLLYNYSAVKKGREEECYLVEGFFDVISLTQKGIENCLALLGTNLSEEQLKLLIDLKKKIIIFLDSDNAGQEATINTAIKLLFNEVDCEIVKWEQKGDPDEICRFLDQESLHTTLQKREQPYPFILNYYYAKWEVEENPQRVSRFISEVAKIFQKFKLNIRNFLAEKISSLVKWNKEEVENYFIQWNFPTYDLRSHQIIYCQELIQEREKRLVCIGSHEQNLWLIIMKKNYFFFNHNSRKIYQNIYNYYDSSPENKLYSTKTGTCYCQLTPEKENELVTFSEKKMFINKIFQEIKTVKNFLLNCQLTK